MNTEPRAEEAINETLATWAAAIRAADLERLADLVTEDAEFWTQGAPPLVGRKALKEAFEPFFAEYTMHQEFRVAELIVSGELAFMRGLEVNLLTPRQDGDSMEVRQRAFSVLRRDKDGRWRFFRGMTNTPPES